MNLQAKISAALAALSVLIALSAAIIYYRSALDVERSKNSVLEAQSASFQAALESQTKLYTDRELAISQVNQIRVDFEALKGDIRSQGRKLDQAIQQVKENDKAVQDYLSQPVPDALGRLFIREATTDPRLYGVGEQGGTMHPDTMPTPGIQSTSKQ